ncbi:MAG: ABC transporter permease [candidate division Zixibacteria bacterium]|nr:ABC transporter permease [candidate division Zixibacteria bacterium]
MLRNYIMVAVRSILRHKGHTFINITGLAVGTATCILIMLWVVDEMSFDRFHRGADHTYRLCHELVLGGTTLRTPTGGDPMATAIQAACPEVMAITRLIPGNRTEVRYGDNRFFEENIVYADSQFFSVFTYPLIQGDPRTALARGHSVVITADIARKYFGDEDPMGKVLQSWGNDYTVTGVIDKVATNSHLSFDLLRSYRSFYSDESDDVLRWGNLNVYTYLRAVPDAAVEDLEGKISSVIEERMGKQVKKEKGNSLTPYLQPLTEIHLDSDSDFVQDIAARQGSFTYVLLFIGIALGVLLIACANFINLMTAGSAHRMKEIGVRKVFGADRHRLTLQFLIESILLSFAALVVALILIEISLPFFNTMIQRDLKLEYFAHVWTIPGLVLFGLLVGLVAGIYPAVSLSLMKPVAVLKTAYRPTDSRSVLGRILVVGQYTISIALIIGTAIIYDQVNFMKKKNLGFAEDQLLVIRGLGSLPSAATVGVTLKSEIARTPGVIGAGLSSTVPGGDNIVMTNFRPEGFDSEDMLMVQMYADESYQPTFGLELTGGRNFSSQMGSDSVDALLINEAAARKLGWEDPVGKTIKERVSTPEGLGWHPRKVVGVVKDFHYTNLREAIEPLIIICSSPPFGYLSVRVETKDISHTLALIRDRWEQLCGEAPFDYFFVDQRFAELYRADEQLGKIAISFSLLAVFVACLGLFGMASHTARRRTKEIGVRKVMGATTRGIAALLTGELVKWVLIANVIAWPIAYYTMNRWLQNFAYRTSISLSVFVLSAALALVVAIATVGYQAVRAAHANPVDSLKYE